MQKIFLIDDLKPEDLAMLQALYSRSSESAEAHVDKARASSGKFMEQFYVNYGHKSIADCGSTTLFFEGVSLLAAKAIQDWPLYSGQETSTRYIDMTKQPIIDPICTQASQAILTDWMAFYRAAQPATADEVRRRYPQRPDEADVTYDRAVKARTFDIMRGFLPAGITTQLSWHTNLRQASDHLLGLDRHPAWEIQELAGVARELLAQRYPSSGFTKALAAVSGEANWLDAAQEARRHWDSDVAEATYREAPTAPFMVMSKSGDLAFRKIHEHQVLLQTRPRGCVLPHFMTELGQVQYRFELDFGSFRDLQRHRNGVCRMPLLTTEHGFEQWYLDQLDSVTRGAAEDLIARQDYAISKIGASAVEQQYLVALGYRVPCQVTYALPALLYVLELRSGKMVHPTLRTVVHNMITMFRDAFPDIALHVDTDPDNWDARRGDQTITKKETP